MKPVLIDTGPIVALLDVGDADHEPCVAAARQIRGRLVTTWPVITEAMYLLAASPDGQDALLGQVETGAVAILELTEADVAGMRTLMAKYRDQPMDFADASLVHTAEREDITEVFTLDRDFEVYRLPRGRRFLTRP